MGEKRKNNGGQGGGKKKYKVNNGIVDPSTSGVYATCTRRKEKACAAELRELLEEAAEELYGDKLREEVEESDNDDDNEEEELSIEESLKKELEGLKEKKKNIKKEPIRYIDLGCECVVFFKLRKPIIPEEIVAKICKDAAESKSKNTRYTQKLTPITNSVSATIEEVEKLAKKVLAPHFHKEEGQEPHTFAIKVSSRNFNSVEKGEILKRVAGCVGKEHGHKVDLKKYDKLILVECFKNNIGMSVVDDYDKYQKYNLQQIFEKKAPVENTDSRVKAATTEAKEQES